jgi:hypothetical protein
VVYRPAWLTRTLCRLGILGRACWIYRLPIMPPLAAPISSGASTSVRISGAVDALNGLEHH